MKQKIVKLRVISIGDAEAYEPASENARLLTYLTKRNWFSIEDLKVLSLLGFKIETTR
jgi:hypothetical protein